MYRVSGECCVPEPSGAGAWLASAVPFRRDLQLQVQLLKRHTLTPSQARSQHLHRAPVSSNHVYFTRGKGGVVLQFQELYPLP